ncbi:uncharacterized protein LOC133730546 [Rosa rugosa]|uniref:uncharacterized protein LOC133730546 n=1 Tax=Rosa rugosa TaxID=74645 RepID=UPI002B4121B9|nr:uncharacterized protein LOC133730546 [Rosa rugosa]
MAIQAVSAPVFDSLYLIDQACHADPEAQSIIQALTQGNPTKKGFTLPNDRLLYKGRFFVPSISEWKPKILHEFHSSLLAGHSGYMRTLNRLSRSFAWPGMHRDVKTFVKACDQSFFKLQGSTLCRSSTYHPQSDSQTEVINRTLEHYLRCFIADKPSNWSALLHWAKWWYNTTYHATIKMTPFEAFYGQPPPSIFKNLPGTTQVHAVDVALK